MITAPLLDQRFVLVVEEERPVKVGLRRRPVELAVPGHVVIGQELNWHTAR